MTEKLINFLNSSQDKFDISIHIVDDGSYDETEEKLRFHPKITYIRGDGNLFWAKSMKLAQDSVIQPIDYLLWLNNDVELFPGFFDLLSDSVEKHPDSILVGQTIDPITREFTYGGLRRLGKHPHRMAKVHASNNFEAADTFCGNIVLIPKYINDVLGGIDGVFEHGYADYDFGLRATKLRIDIRVIPGSLGACSFNPNPYIGKTRREILSMMLSRKYLPIRSQIRYTKRHSGIEWPIYVIIPYLRSVLKIRNFRSKKTSAGF